MYKAKKKYGQNFLIDNHIIDIIVQNVSINHNEKIIEIGPGKGYLTSELIKYNTSLYCFEIDTDMKNYLNKFESNNTKIIFEDFLNVDLNNFFNKNDIIHVIANIPYYITTPIINHLIDSDLNIVDMTLMVQKEVSDRLCSKPGSSEYGYITAYLNYYYEIKKIMDVSKKCFDPVPNVDSSVIQLKLSKKKCKNEDLLFKLLKDSFKLKRKNLRNNLKDYDLNKILEILYKYNMDLTNRAEDLSIDIFIDIANSL